MNQDEIEKLDRMVDLTLDQLTEDHALWESLGVALEKVYGSSVHGSDLTELDLKAIRISILTTIAMVRRRRTQKAFDLFRTITGVVL